MLARGAVEQRGVSVLVSMHQPLLYYRRVYAGDTNDISWTRAEQLRRLISRTMGAAWLLDLEGFAWTLRYLLPGDPVYVLGQVRLVEPGTRQEHRFNAGLYRQNALVPRLTQPQDQPGIIAGMHRDDLLQHLDSDQR